MLRLGILLAFLLVAEQSLGQYCQDIEHYYQQNTGSLFFKREERTKHLVKLLNQTSNRFKLIGDIYLHYRSIEDVSDQLSVNLELCLLDLLQIARHDQFFKAAIKQRSFFNRTKVRDPVHAFFAQNIVNANFTLTNKNTLSRLIELDKLETAFFKNESIDQSYFEPVPTAESLILMRQTFKELCEAIITLDYYGHYFFIKLHVAPAEELLLLLGNKVNTETLRSAVVAYKEKPTAKTFEEIRAAVRAIYRRVLGAHLALSPREYWEHVLREAQLIKAEAIAEADSEVERAQVGQILEQNLRYAINNSDLDDLNGVKESAELIIEALGEPYEQNCYRIRQIFFEK